jgi:hypothetical protein
MIDISSIIKGLKKNETKSACINKDSLSLCCYDQRRLIKWMENEITSAHGFYTGISVLNCTYYSFDSEWSLQSRGKSELILNVRFKDIPINQIWMFKLSNSYCISWDVRIEFEEGLDVDNAQAGIFLSDKYINWINTYEEAPFLPIRGWQDMYLDNLESRVIGVRGFRDKNGFMPTMLINFSENRLPGIPFIKNTSKELNSRLLGVSLEGGYKKEGLYNFFNCKIELVDSEEKTDLFIEDIRNRILKDRKLGFIFK